MATQSYGPNGQRAVVELSPYGCQVAILKVTQDQNV